MFSMNESSNYTENVVAQKAEGSWLPKRILLIVLYVAAGLLWLVGVVGILKIWLLWMFLPILIWMLVFFTWRYVAVEHEYTMASGVITFSEIYGRRSRRQKCEFKIRELTKIAPVSDAYKNDYDAKDISVRYDFRGTVKSPDSYFFTFKTADGKAGVVYFEATAKALKIFRFYNPSATVMSSTLRY